MRLLTGLLPLRTYNNCQIEYNEERAHSSWGYRMPKEFATAMKAAEAGSALLAPPSSAANPDTESVVRFRARRAGAGGQVIYMDEKIEAGQLYPTRSAPGWRGPQQGQQLLL
jgi:hypothetical protein